MFEIKHYCYDWICEVLEEYVVSIPYTIYVLFCIILGTRHYLYDSCNKLRSATIFGDLRVLTLHNLRFYSFCRWHYGFVIDSDRAIQISEDFINFEAKIVMILPVF